MKYIKLVKFSSYQSYINRLLDRKQQKNLHLILASNPLAGNPLEEAPLIFKFTFKDIDVFYLISKDLDKLYLIAAEEHRTNSTKKSDSAIDWKEIFDISRKIPDVISLSDLLEAIKQTVENLFP